MERLRALNVVALIEFSIDDLDKYYVKRLLDHAHNRQNMHSLLNDKLLRRVGNIDIKNIVQLDINLFQVPSATTDNGIKIDFYKIRWNLFKKLFFLGLIYEVNTEIGYCSCKAGDRGTFCKHMALLVEHFNVSLPCAPPLRSTDRHALAKLALGDKCPEEKFFLSITEPVNNNGGSVEGMFISDLRFE